MDHNRFEDLKAAYALDALSEEERREFETYLAENPSERAEVEELSSIADLLAIAPQEQKPPAGLRRSLMDQVRSEASASRESGAGYEAAAWPDSRERRGGWARRLFGARGLATAAAAVALIGLAIWNVSLQSEVRDLRNFQMSAYELQGSGQAQAAHGQVVSLGEKGAMLVAADLPELPEDKSYEMWSIDEKQPQSCGVFKAGGGIAIESIESPLSDSEQFAITVEPEGGSEQPTTDPIILADLTSGA